MSKSTNFLDADTSVLDTKLRIVRVSIYTFLIRLVSTICRCVMFHCVTSLFTKINVLKWLTR